MIITIKHLRNNPDTIFVFGDNSIRQGKGGAAALRDEPNTYGFITKKYPNNRDSSFYTVKEYSLIFPVELKKLADLIEAKQDKIFLVSKLGAGLANKHYIYEEIIQPGINVLKM